MKDTRAVTDSMGEMNVPTDALYGAQTQRAAQNFQISDLKMPRAFIRAIGLIKASCALTNQDLGELKPEMAAAIAKAAVAVAAGEHDGEFIVDVFQTGSGTSSNMNGNEVIATLASRALEKEVHPNDHVNMSQSSNDVIPTAIHVSAALLIQESLMPALDHLTSTIETKARDIGTVVKTGRTHLMDAMPITMAQELGAWAEQIWTNTSRLQDGLDRLLALPQGGTAVGTGVNASPEFGPRFAEHLTHMTSLNFRSKTNKFEGLATQDTAVEMSGHLNTLAVSLTKIANDLRWMNSGPLAGLGEIALPALQPGSSIMPGKVNPVIPEAVLMACCQVMGNHSTITMAGAAGNFQLNVMLPIIAYNLLQSISLMSASARHLADLAISDFTINHDQLEKALTMNPILVTALNSIVGYETGAAIAKQAYKEKRPVIDVALEHTELSREELQKLLDPLKLTQSD